MIFDNIMKQYSLHEADNTGDDNTNQPQQQNQNTGDNAEDNQDTTTDTGDDDEYSVNDPDAEGNDDTTDDQNQDDTQEDTEDEYSVTDPDEEGADDTQPDENEGEDGEDDEYSVNDPDKEGMDDTQDDTSSTDENDPSAKLKDLEKSIFDQLPPEMQKAKASELKKLYTDTYEKCQSIIDIISTAKKQPNQVKVYDYILNSLLDLQKYIKDYLTNIFDSKTYIENMTELQKYLAILDTVNGVFEDMAKPSTEDNNK